MALPLRPSGEQDSYVKLDYVHDHVETVHRSKRLSARLPLVVLLFISYLTMMETHFDVYAIHQLEMALEAAYIYKKVPATNMKFMEIHTVSEFWDWMEGVFIPSSFAAQTDPLGVTTDPESWGRIARYSKIIGGIRIEQKRLKPGPCKIHDLDDFYGNVCHPVGPTIEIDDRPFGVALCNTNSSSNECVDVESYSPPLNARTYLDGSAVVCICELITPFFSFPNCIILTECMFFSLAHNA